jgi:hypothetical protein
MLEDLTDENSKYVQYGLSRKEDIWSLFDEYNKKINKRVYILKNPND